MARKTQPQTAAAEPLLDLHGLRVTEAVSRTTAFLVHEQTRGTISVRIVTGHGTGALKAAIRAVLQSHPAVAASRPALGTDAVTLVILMPPRASPSNARQG
jgi:DNA mismatch repair protein MutS2